MAADGLYYAPDPSSQQVCTIGGNVAENSGGAHCLKHGFTVNHVLAAKFGRTVSTGNLAVRAGLDSVTDTKGSELRFTVAGTLIEALRPYDAWVSGIRRQQSPSRANARKAERSERYGVWKIQPIVDWDAKRVQAYIYVNEIPYNPLHDAGYPSIGCAPCTRAVAIGDSHRAGRWAGSTKTECGIHT